MSIDYNNQHIYQDIHLTILTLLIKTKKSKVHSCLQTFSVSNWDQGLKLGVTYDYKHFHSQKFLNRFLKDFLLQSDNIKMQYCSCEGIVNSYSPHHFFSFNLHAMTLNIQEHRKWHLYNNWMQTTLDNILTELVRVLKNGWSIWCFTLVYLSTDSILKRFIATMAPIGNVTIGAG